MSSASAQIEIAAPIKDVFQVISDFEAYPEFLSETKKVTILKKSAKSMRVEFQVQMIKKIKYTLDIKLAAPKSVSWTLVEGDFMKKSVGAWKLSSKKGMTQAKYEIDMEFGGLVPKAISDKLIGTNLPSMMQAFRDRAEELS